MVNKVLFCFEYLDKRGEEVKSARAKNKPKNLIEKKVNMKIKRDVIFSITI